jgi:hypothetical protein
MDWFVQIEGEQSILQELSMSLNSPELCIFQDNQKYFLKCAEFDILETAENVFHKAKELLPILSGATQLELRHPLKLGNVFKRNDDGTLQEFGFGWMSAECPRPFLQAAGEGAKVSNLADRVPIWFKVAQRDDKVAEALTLFGANELNWVLLYKIYEIIRDNLGGEQIFRNKQQLSKDGLNRFTQTAQPHRHARNSVTINNWKPHEKPMSFYEAKTFIKYILDNWLRSKEQSEKST